MNLSLCILVIFLHRVLEHFDGGQNEETCVLLAVPEHFVAWLVVYLVLHHKVNLQLVEGLRLPVVAVQTLLLLKFESVQSIDFLKLVLEACLLPVGLGRLLVFSGLIA